MPRDLLTATHVVLRNVQARGKKKKHKTMNVLPKSKKHKTCNEYNLRKYYGSDVAPISITWSDLMSIVRPVKRSTCDRKDKLEAYWIKFSAQVHVTQQIKCFRFDFYA